MKAIVFLFVFLLTGIRVILVLTTNFADNSYVRISGAVFNQPFESFDRQIVRLGNLKVRVPGDDIKYGDYIVVEGVITDNEIADAKLVSHFKDESIFSAFRTRLVSFIDSSLPEPHSALLAGIVLGAKQSLPKDFYESLKTTGTAHVVVASGMNVTLVGGFILNFLVQFFNRRKAVSIAIGVIWIYVLIAGLQAPLVRAGIMGSLAFAAQSLGRVNKALWTLVLSLLLMLFIYPWWVFDLGLWLSFAATGSLILFGSKVDRLVYFVPKILRDGLSTSLAAQIGVTPILLFSFGSISLVGPIVNALILWTVTPIMIIGLVGVLGGMLIPSLGQLVLYLTYPLTSWFIAVVDLFS